MRLILKYFVLLALLLILILLLSFSLHGLPDSLARRLERRIQLPGLAVIPDRIKLGIFEGIIATDVRFYVKGEIGDPVVIAKRIVLQPRLFHNMRWAPGLRRLLIKDASARLPPGIFSEASAGNLRLTQAGARIVFDSPQSLRVDNFTARLAGINLAGHGRIRLPAAPAAPHSETTPASEQPPFEIIDRLFQHYQTMSFTRAPYIQTEFDLYPGQPQKNTIDFHLEVPEAQTADYRITGLQARLRLRQSRLHGELALRESVSLDLPLRDFSAHFAVTPDTLIVHDARAICGAAPHNGTILMNAAYNFNRDALHGEIRSDLDPAAFLPLLQRLELKHLAATLADFEFPERPPFVNGNFHGRLRNRPGLWMTGTAGADDLIYEQVPVAAVETAFTAGFCATNAVLDFHPTIVTRRDGVLQGRLLLDFGREFVGFDAISASDPHAVARMIHPVVAEAVAPFTFNGPAQARAAGTVGFSGQTGDAVEVALECRQAGWHFLLADFCRLHLQVTDESIELTDITGDIFGGHFTGEVLFHQQAAVRDYFYEAQTRFTEVDFQKLMQAFGAHRPETYRGRLRLQIQIAGTVDEQAAGRATGRGRITISDGRVFQIPLFGGLSDMLARLLPGMGLIMRQTDMQADFRVEDGRISSDDIRIEGDILSLRASGHCLMDGRLDFRVQITLLRRHTLAAIIMRLATFPVSKILEFHLTGTLEDPQWRMTYLPRDIFNLFGGAAAASEDAPR